MKHRIEEATYIAHADVERYRKAGWTVTPLPLPHGHYSALAVREVKDDEGDAE